MKVLSRRRVVSPLISCLLLVFLFVYLAPILWMIVTSVKVGGDILTWPPIFIPAHPTLQNYKELIQNDNLLTYFRNSAIATVGGAVLATALGTLAAYGFVRLRWRWGLNRHLSLWILSLRMMPPVAALLPITILWTHLNLSDTYQGLILAYVFFTLPFAIWLMQIFMSAVPEEISEAAQVDGLSHIQIFRHIMLPLVAPGLATTLLLSANLLWNEFLF